MIDFLRLSDVSLCYHPTIKRETYVDICYISLYIHSSLSLDFLFSSFFFLRFTYWKRLSWTRNRAFLYNRINPFSNSRNPYSEYGVLHQYKVFIAQVGEIKCVVLYVYTCSYLQMRNCSAYPPNLYHQETRVLQTILALAPSQRDRTSDSKKKKF